MLIITKGYLLKKENYGDFDELITLINEYGNKFVCISPGSRKIISKNAYHLNVGNYLEFEFFYSEKKLSKLKKVKTLSYVEENAKLNFALHFINDAFSGLELGGLKWFAYYQKVIYYILKDINDYLIILNICVFIYKNSGLIISFEECCICHTKYHIKTIDFNQKQVVCKACFNLEKHRLYQVKTLDLLYLMQTKDVLVDTLKIKIDVDELKHLIKSLVIFLYENLGIYIETFKWL